MSGASATYARENIPLPAWAAHDRYTVTPEKFFTRLFRIFSNVELAVLGNIVNEIGRPVSDPRTGRRFRRDWVAISETELSKRADCHPNAVQRALKFLELTGAIKTRRSENDGRAKEYTLCVQEWSRISRSQADEIRERLRPREPDEVAAANAQQSSDAAGESESESEPQQLCFVFTADDPHARAIRLCKSCSERLRQTAPECGAKIGRIPMQAEGLAATIPTLECGQSGAPPPPPSPPAAPGADPGLAEFIGFLEAKLAPALKSLVPRPLAEAQYQRLVAADVPLQDFVVRFDLRRRYIQSYGMVACIVDDCVGAYRAARKARAAADKRTCQETEKYSARWIEHLRQCLAKLKKVAGFTEIENLLRARIRDAAKVTVDVGFAVLDIEVVEAQLFAIAEDLLNARARARLEAELETETRDYRRRMTTEQFEEIRQMVWRQLLAEHLRLPRLTDFL